MCGGSATVVAIDGMLPAHAKRTVNARSTRAGVREGLQNGQPRAALCTGQARYPEKDQRNNLTAPEAKAKRHSSDQAMDLKEVPAETPPHFEADAQSVRTSEHVADSNPESLMSKTSQRP